MKNTHCMKCMKAILVGTLTVFLGLTDGWCASLLGTALNYQGRLNDGAGAASGGYDFTFTLYDATTGGGQIGSPFATNAVAVSNGLFVVALDFGPGAFTGDARWLEIAVRTNGGGVFTSLVPRQPLTATPYALYASSAGTATTAATATTAETATTAAVATTASSVANNAVTASGIQTGQVVKNLNGLTDQVLLSAGTNVLLRTNGNTLAVSAGPWLPANFTNTWFSGGKVGIGKAPAAGMLDVFDGTGSNQSGGSIHVGSLSPNGDPKLIHFGDMQGSGLGYVYLGENGQDDTLELRASRFYFNNGNVGIFKTNPATALDVVGTVTATGFSGPGTGLTGIPTTGLADNSVTTAKLASDANSLSKVSAGSLNLSGGALSLTVNEYLNDRDLYLRSDTFHGLGWSGAGKLFANRNDNGPALYGADGGVLGTTSGGQQWALSWNKDANVTAHGALSLDNGNANTGSVNRAALTFGAGSGEGIASKRNAGGNQAGLDFYTAAQPRLSIDNVGNIQLAGNTWLQDNTLYLRNFNESQQGLGWFGPGHPFGGVLQPNGPILFGWEGGMLVSRSGGDKVALSWDNQQRVGTGKTPPASALDVNGTVTATSFSGAHSGNGSGLTSVNADMLDSQHGSFYQNAGNLNAGTLADARLSANIPRLNANQEFTGVNTFATAVGIGTPTPWAALLDVEGDVRINKHDLLFYPGNDMYHGVGFYGGDKLFAGVNVNGPVLYGNGGGALGSVGASSKIALQWNDSQNVIGYGDISAPTVTATSQLRIYGARTVLSGFDGTGSHWFGPDPDSDLAFGIRRAGINDYDFSLKGRFYAASFNTTSDRNAKENVQPVNTQAVLEKVAGLPISEWNFKGDAATPHLGPMAQDFHAAFGVGTDDKHIATVDADGVALAAIQGLNQKLEEQLRAKDARIQSLEERLAALEKLMRSRNP